MDVSLYLARRHPFDFNQDTRARMDKKEMVSGLHPRRAASSSVSPFSIRPVGISHSKRYTSNALGVNQQDFIAFVKYDNANGFMRIVNLMIFFYGISIRHFYK